MPGPGLGRGLLAGLAVGLREGPFVWYLRPWWAHSAVPRGTAPNIFGAALHVLVRFRRVEGLAVAGCQSTMQNTPSFLLPPRETGTGRPLRVAASHGSRHVCTESKSPIVIQPHPGLGSGLGSFACAAQNRWDGVRHPLGMHSWHLPPRCPFLLQAQQKCIKTIEDAMAKCSGSAANIPLGPVPLFAGWTVVYHLGPSPLALTSLGFGATHTQPHPNHRS